MKITDKRLDEITGFGQQYRLKTDEKILMARELKAARLVARAAKAVLPDYEHGLHSMTNDGLLGEESAKQCWGLASDLREALKLHLNIMEGDK